MQRSFIHCFMCMGKLDPQLSWNCSDNNNLGKSEAAFCAFDFAAFLLVILNCHKFECCSTCLSFTAMLN